MNVQNAFFTIQSIRQMNLNEAADDETLVVFDIDDTLTILRDPVFQRPNFTTHHRASIKEVFAGVAPEVEALAFTMPLLTTESDLIEADAPQYISSLQGRVRTIALTAAMGGSIEGASIEERRASELRRVGIDFSTSFPEITELAFAGFDQPVIGHPPLFNRGIILTNDNNKGEVLVQFLNNIAWRPKRIHFVDDRDEHLLKVQNALLAHFPTITFTGYHFQPQNAPYTNTTTEHFETQWGKVAVKAQEVFDAGNYFP